MFHWLFGNHSEEMFQRKHKHNAQETIEEETEILPGASQKVF